MDALLDEVGCDPSIVYGSRHAAVTDGSRRERTAGSRIATHPRVTATPLTGPEAWALVARWLERDVTWVPPAGRRTADVLGELVRTHHVTGDLMPDAMLAALAIEHGLTVMSADSDFARLPEVLWENPLSAR